MTAPYCQTCPYLLTLQAQCDSGKISIVMKKRCGGEVTGHIHALILAMTELKTWVALLGMGAL